MKSRQKNILKYVLIQVIPSSNDPLDRVPVKENCLQNANIQSIRNKVQEFEMLLKANNIFIVPVLMNIGLGKMIFQ